MKTTLLSPEELEAVRRKFPPALQRKRVLSLIASFGVSMSKARQMIEGEDAPFKPLPKRHESDWAVWAREPIIQQLNTYDA